MRLHKLNQFTGYMEQAVRHFAAAPPGLHLLDLPAGNGQVTDALRRLGHHVTPADINRRRDDYAARQDQLQRAWTAFTQTIDAWGAEVLALTGRIVNEFTRAETGDCTEEQHRRLQNAVDSACKRPRACAGQVAAAR